MPKSGGGDFNLKWVTPNLASVLRMKVLAGRFIGANDRRGSAPVVVVNEAYVQQFLTPGSEPVGVEIPLRQAQRIVLSEPPVLVRIVGVVANTLHRADGPTPVLYVPQTQRYELWQDAYVGWALRHAFLVRTNPSMDLDPATLTDAIYTVDSALPIRTSTSLEALRGELMNESTFYMALLAIFASVALLLASVGVFSVLAQLIRHRTREIGVRRTLGATRSDIIARILGYGGRLALIGLSLGLLAAYYGAKVLDATIVEMQAWSPIPQLVVVLALLGTVLLASWLQALRTG